MTPQPDPQRDDGELNPIEALSALEETSRANIIADIVGHPKGMPSKTEIDHMNPSLAPSTISGHLNTLQKKGLIESAEWGREGHPKSAPRKFYYITEQAHELFDRNNLFDENAYRDAYAEVKKPAEIRAAETAERPAVSVSTVQIG
ncbi:ArsR family transcriptional regulator [Halobacteriaceae archaeon GCM10025711]